MDQLKKKVEVDKKVEEIERTFIYEVKNGCPLCGGAVKGNDHYKYFCEKCNVLFDKIDLAEEEFKPVEDEKKEIEEPEMDYDEESEVVEEISSEEIKPEKEVVVQDKEEYDLEDEKKIIASSQSTKIHKGNCHFVKKIHPENRIYFETAEEGEEKKYEMCVCLRRLKAMEKKN